MKNTLLIQEYVKQVRESYNMPYVQLTRTNPGFVKRLFELEVPEIQTGEVEIKSIVREAGYRTKIAVYASNANIDAVGACVGNKGMRVNAIVAELNGEKTSLAVVPDDKLSLAIGKSGQNVRLAARLTNWKIDVKAKSTVPSLNLDDSQELNVNQDGNEEYKDLFGDDDSFFNDDME